VLADAVAVAPRLPELLEGVAEPAEARHLIEPHDPYGALLALALDEEGPSVAWIGRYFEELRGVALEISGADLAVLGLGESPRVGEVLDELLRRKLNGDIVGREEELAAAAELLASPVGAQPDRRGH